jgi:hypothetical protein
VARDSGQTHDDKGLKRRPVGEKRVVPIPPELVRILIWHLEELSTSGCVDSWLSWLGRRRWMTPRCELSSSEPIV